MHNLMPRSYRDMVTTPHYLASQVGSAILIQGGNAIDAAVAVSAALAVVYPHMTGLGGDSFFMIYSAQAGKLVGLNGSGRAAAAANPAHFLRDGMSRPPDRGVQSAITVPGMVDAWWEVWSKYGKLPWEDLLRPALRYAEEGVPISRNLHVWMARDEPLLRADPILRDLYIDPLMNTIKPEGAKLKQPQLADSLRTLMQEGRDAFYEGSLMKAIIDAVRADGGLLAESDFTSHRSEWAEPLAVEYRGVQVCQMPPNSQGFSLLMMLNMLELFDLKRIPRNSSAFYHLVTEVVKRAFRYRDMHLSDPAFNSIPLELLLSREMAEQLVDEIRKNPAQTSEFESEPAGQDTAYAAVVDEEGNAVSFIQSLYYDFGSAYTAGQTGIILQNRGSYFSLDHAHPNVLAPGKRPFHTLMPGMALKDGKPIMLMGTQGGEGQPQTQLSLITGVLDYGCSIHEAISLPRWVYGRTWGDDSDRLRLENRDLGDAAERLKAWGHKVDVVDGWDGMMGQAQGILIGCDGIISGAADPRGDGLAIGS
ncbi:gamma-glutamyltransferase [Paenibacillus lignilyticus]|uniref:Glutathione hydrolase proenzyme n=1 Tax=Paenibacillus lignilyticus TaxID=1172615 RepID=A0ABS5C6J8_9BACL|nr:gamma-glutamyltransferase [Paenibacillus lignilyticus]MBP3961533.1 gamma-glutamyltransferase [Paenibacillus lignilyticus]MBP3963797.1 gamma-glutamyltransferase [Paenibacillus lignilyticus]